MSAIVPSQLLREWDGPLTRELVLEPSRFGLGHVPARLQPDATTTVVCGFCSTGCGLNVHLKDGEAINLSATASYPVNLGMACPKGWESLTPLAAPDRATTPLLRNEKSGKLEPVSWVRAMQEFAQRFKGIVERHGPESIAFLSTGQICTEEMALLGAMFKFGMGGVHCDSNTRQCMATSHVAYKQSFGFDAPPFTYADFEKSDTLIFIGSNPCIAHPIMWQRVLRNPNLPEIIVVDPRKTETAMAATQHYAITPKSDLVLLYGLANLLIHNDRITRDFIDTHTTGFDEFRGFVRQFTPDMVANRTGLTVGQLFRFADVIARGKAVSFWWTMGVNQGHEATRTAQAIINLALMTGNIGRPGTGANSITGQCNAMGSRLFANITGLPAGRDFLNPTHREQIAGLLGIPLERIPDCNSWAYDQIVQGVADGKIKGLWVIATNPSHSWIGRGEDVTSSNRCTVESANRSATGRFNESLDKLEFLVAQDMYHSTETARRAHLILPAAGWGEKDGTFINSERRFGLVKKVKRAPGQALSDFNIFKLVAESWGCEEMFREWSSPEAVFQILKRLSAGQPCDITGIRDYKHLDECGGIQWPWKEKSRESRNEDREQAIASNPGLRPSTLDPRPSSERRLFEDGRFFTPDGKARFIFEEPRDAPELPDEEFPFFLLTGRGTSAQWHTNTRTGKSAVLRQLYPENIYVEINPDDARRLGISANQKVEIVSRRACIVATVHVVSTVQPGQVFIPMHYGATNRLTYPAFDPYSRQPSYKSCAVKLQSLGNGKFARVRA